MWFRYLIIFMYINFWFVILGFSFIYPFMHLLLNYFKISTGVEFLRYMFVIFCLHFLLKGFCWAFSFLFFLQEMWMRISEWRLLTADSTGIICLCVKEWPKLHVVFFVWNIHNRNWFPQKYFDFLVWISPFFLELHFPNVRF